MIRSPRRRPAMPVKPIPDGYHAVTPYLIVKGAARRSSSTRRRSARRRSSGWTAPDGKIGHAEIQIGDSRVMLADEHPEMGAVAPRRPAATRSRSSSTSTTSTGGSRARSPRARSSCGRSRTSSTATVGDARRTRSATCWSIATHKEDLTPERDATSARSRGTASRMSDAAMDALAAAASRSSSS